MTCVAVDRVMTRTEKEGALHSLLRSTLDLLASTPVMLVAMTSERVCKLIHIIIRDGKCLQLSVSHFN